MAALGRISIAWKRALQQSKMRTARELASIHEKLDSVSAMQSGTKDVSPSSGRHRKISKNSNSSNNDNSKNINSNDNNDNNNNKDEDGGPQRLSLDNNSNEDDDDDDDLDPDFIMPPPWVVIMLQRWVRYFQAKREAERMRALQSEELRAWQRRHFQSEDEKSVEVKEESNTSLSSRSSSEEVLVKKVKTTATRRQPRRPSVNARHSIGATATRAQARKSRVAAGTLAPRQTRATIKNVTPASGLGLARPSTGAREAQRGGTSTSISAGENSPSRRRRSINTAQQPGQSTASAPVPAPTDSARPTSGSGGHSYSNGHGQRDGAPGIFDEDGDDQGAAVSHGKSRPKTQPLRRVSRTGAPPHIHATGPISLFRARG